MANFQQIKYLDRNSPPHITTLVLMAAVASMPLNIFLAALPEMAVHFQKPYAVMQFALTGFLIMTSVLQIFLGPISDRIGRRPVMLASLFLFVLTSIGVANSTDFVMFMTFRLLQGVIVAGFVISRASIRDVSAREKAASMMSYVTMGMALMPMLAPFIGGVLSTHYGWQSSFYLLAILGALIFIVIFFDQGETNSYTNRSIFDQFRAYPALLKSRRFWGYSCTLMFASGTFFAYLGGAPFVGSYIYGLDATQVGIFMGITPIGYMFGNGFSARFAERLGIFRMITIGAFIPLIAMSFSGTALILGIAHPLGFFGFTFFIGFGNGWVIPSANAGLLEINPSLAGSAMGLSGAMMTCGGAILATFLGALLSIESGALPLVICIALTALAGLLSARYTIGIERKQAA